MKDEERMVWRYLVREANRLGQQGQRVIVADVLCPLSAAANYAPVILTDNGPKTASEQW